MKGDYIIGADVGGTYVKMALLDKDGKILARERFPSDASLGKNRLVNNLVRYISELRGKTNQSGAILQAVGMGVAGLIRSKEGIVSFSPNLPELKEFPLVDILRKEIGIPIFIDNDVNMIALGEKWMGTGKHLDDFLCITLGTGVGGGLILNGKLWQGSSSYSAAELGHMSLDIEGERCNCGGIGCLETFASATGLIRWAQRRIKGGEKSTIPNLVQGDLDTLTAEHLSHAAQKGDKLALDLFRIMGKALGLSIANVINLLGLTAVIIGGGLTSAWDLFVGSLLDQMEKQVLSVPVEMIRILRAQLGDNAGIFGSAKMALQKLEGI